MTDISKCQDENPKEFEVVIDAGILGHKIILLCSDCNNKPEFQKFKISAKKIGVVGDVL